MKTVLVILLMRFLRFMSSVILVTAAWAGALAENAISVDALNSGPDTAVIAKSPSIFSSRYLSTVAVQVLTSANGLPPFNKKGEYTNGEKQL